MNKPIYFISGIMIGIILSVIFHLYEMDKTNAQILSYIAQENENCKKLTIIAKNDGFLKGRLECVNLLNKSIQQTNEVQAQNSLLLEIAERQKNEIILLKKRYYMTRKYNVLPDTLPITKY